MANLELLKDAYAIIDGIPESKFDLSFFIDGNPRKPGACGTLACAGGWLGMHPQFQALGLTTFRQWPTLRGPMDTDGYEALAKVFDMHFTDAVNLFSTPGDSKYDMEMPRFISDKRRWQMRVLAYLAEREQP